MEVEVTQQNRDDRTLIRELRAGSEAAFEELVRRYHRHLLPLANFYVTNPAAAEEVLQETWIAVLHGIGRFEEKSSLKTWLSRIVMNRAMTKGEREKRMTPFSMLARSETERFQPAVHPDRFRGPDESFAGHWSAGPESWGPDPEKALLNNEMMKMISDAIGDLPDAQRLVITMRDVNDWTSDEVCNTLHISETNQRVLLHRARARVRSLIEDYLRTSGDARDEKRMDLQRTG
jgi:RNA polymerase sigma-70 factor (ECF subfamily)